MRALASLTSFVLLLMLHGPALAEAAGSEADANITDVPETLTGAQKVAQNADDASEDATQDAQPASTDGEGSSDGLLDQAQLDQLVAPIALYPDSLLAQVLVAATYPLEVVQAERWAADNKDVKGEALTKAMDEKDWDNSIKALVAVPDVLSMMNKDLDWTAKLGDAVLAQQPDVMAAVQHMRALAKDNGQLESNDQQTVTVTQEVNVNQAPAPASSSSGGQAPPPEQVIVIEQTSPETVYVPYYEPAVVYGAWPYPSDPPYYFPPPVGYGFGGALARGVAWSAGFAIGNAIWGTSFNWGRNDINVNVNRNVDFSPNANFNRNNVNVSNWQHNADHRRGVNYNNKNVSNKFNKNNVANKREDFRGRAPGDKRPGNQRPGDKRPNVGDMERALDKKPGVGDKGLGDKRPGAGNKRPNVGDMEKALKQKPGAGDKRPGGGLADKKPGAGDKRPGGGPAAKKPGAGDKRANLQKPGAAKRPDVKKPAAKKPAAKKPAAKRPAPRKPSGNAFNKGSGSKAKAHSNRGRSSVGNRSASRVSRPSGNRGGGGGRRGGGGGRRR